MATLPGKNDNLLGFRLNLETENVSSGEDSLPSPEGESWPKKRTVECDPEQLTLRLQRGSGEPLGMVLVPEERYDHPTRARDVVVQSVTPGGAAARAEVVPGRSNQHDVSLQRQCGFRVSDRLLRIDDEDLDCLDTEDCLAAIQDLPEVCTVVVQRAASSSTFSASSNELAMKSGTLRTSADFVAGRQFKRGPLTSLPKPLPRKVRRQASTAAHLAQKGLPGFQVQQVTIHRLEGENLGISIVPSCGVTKYYYQVKRLQPEAACARSRNLRIGDCLLECNGQSLQGLTQSKCLEVLKAAGARVTLTLLRENPEQEHGAGDEGTCAVDVEIGANNKDGCPGARTGKERNVTDETTRASRLNGEGEPASVLMQRGFYDVNHRLGGSSTAHSASAIAADGTEVTTSTCVSHNSSSENESAPEKVTFLGKCVSEAADGISSAMSDRLNPLSTEEEGEEMDARSRLPHQSGRPAHSDVREMTFDASLPQESFFNQTCTQPYCAETGTLIDFDLIGKTDALENSGLQAGDILVDIFGGSAGTEMHPSQKVQDGSKELDLLGSNQTQFKEHGVDIPPPIDFSDFGAGDTAVCGPSGAQTNPVTNIDDLLGIDFSSEIGMSSSAGGSNAAVDNGLDDSYDFLLDVKEITGEAASKSMINTTGEEPPDLPSEPPPVPALPPPPIPSTTTSLFVPSDNPMDNVTQVSVSPETSPASESSRGRWVHRTDITISSPEANLTTVSITKPRPVPRHRDAKRNGEPLTRTVVPVVDSSVVSSTEIQFDNNTNDAFVKFSLPPNAFIPTPVSVTNALRSGGSDPTQEVEEKGEEQITPMIVHSENQSKLMAAPSPLEALDKQQGEPNSLAEEAKRDLTTKKCDDDEPLEDNIELTSVEAERAQTVLTKWTSDDAEPSSSSKKSSGFQKVVRTMLPTNGRFLTTMGITKTPGSKDQNEEQEEEITPMSVHKDHLGHKHYAPSSQDDWPKLPSLRKLDPSAKEDLAALMSDMPLKNKSTRKPAENTEIGVEEDAIVPTVFSKEESRIAEEALTRWLSGESTQHKSKASPFQSLVENVMESSAKAANTELNKELVEEVVEPAHFANVAPSSKTSAPKPAPPEVKPKPIPPATCPKPPSTLTLKPRCSMVEKITLFEQASEGSSPKTEAATPPASGTQVETGLNVATVVGSSSATSAELKPVSVQRNLRSPTSMASFGQVTALKPKLGVSSGINRGAVPTLAGSRLIPKVEYGKTRSEEAPFLVEVLKGIVGLGIKVKVNDDGHVEVTDIQKNSPVDKNGNMKVGDLVLCVNTTELLGLTEGRVQQVLRLLPRGLVKLVVSAHPPSVSSVHEDDLAHQILAKRGTNSHIGVKLSSRLVSFTSPSSQTPSLISPASLSAAVEVVNPVSTTAAQPLSVSIDVEKEGNEIENDMATRKLSKALSPRSSAAFNYDPEPVTPPRPARRVPASIRAALSGLKSDSSTEEVQDIGETSTLNTEVNLTANKMVAAASRRPSGRDDDLPQPPTLSPRCEALQKEDQDSSSASPNHTAREEDLPVFHEAAKKVSPVPLPRPKPRSTIEVKQENTDQKQPIFEEFTDIKAPATNEESDQASEVIKAQTIVIQSTLPAKIPPPVAPKPKHTLSTVSDISSSSSQFEQSTKDLPSSNIPLSKVSSAAKMFEQKAAETKPVSPMTHPTKTTVRVSSVVKSFNRDSEPDSPVRSEGVVMRRLNRDTDGGKPINRALLPSRRSLPITVSSSLQLTKPSCIQSIKIPPVRTSVLSRSEGFGPEADKSSRFALKPIRSLANKTPLESTSINTSQELDKDTEGSSASTTGKGKESRFTSTQFEVTYRSHSSVHDPHDVLAHRLKRSSWSPQNDDSHCPSSFPASQSLHHSEHFSGSSNSFSSSAGKPDEADVKESTKKKFEDLLSDTYNTDLDDDLQKLSNSETLDILKARNAPDMVDTMTSSTEPDVETLLSPESSKPEPTSSEEQISIQRLVTEGSSDETRDTAVTGICVKESKPPILELDKADHTETLEDKVEIEKIAANSEQDQSYHGPKIILEIKPLESNANGMTADYVISEYRKENELSSTVVTGDSEDNFSEKDSAASLDIHRTGVQSPAAIAEVYETKEMIIHQQASSIVNAILTSVLTDVASTTKQEKEMENEDTPPPLPEEGPPPLPGAPPPPLVLRNSSERLVETADLEGILLSQDSQSLEERSPGIKSSSDVDEPAAHEVKANDIKLEFDKSFRAHDISFSAHQQSSMFEDIQNSRPQHEKATEELISFDSSPPESVALTVRTDLLDESIVRKNDELENVHLENPPVSDTLSQDSGVQDEEMSEDGLRFSQDDSPTTHVDSSEFDSAMTPDEIPVSVLNTPDDKIVGHEVEFHNVTVTQSPVSSPHDMLSPVSPSSQWAKESIACAATMDTDLVDNSLSQVSLSPECFTDHKNVKASLPLGGAIMTGENVVGVPFANDSVTCRSDSGKKEAVERNEVNQLSEKDHTIITDFLLTSGLSQEEVATCEVNSHRKWCILDQSGSLFLHGESDKTVSIDKAMLRQVSSLSLEELVNMLKEGNRDLDDAKLLSTLELRIVSARSLNGSPVKVDVSQREDYFVQVVRVVSKDSCLQVADLLLSVDGHSVRHRRPAQVHVQIDSTGPKGVLLTARGVKLPPSVVKQLAQSQEASQEQPVLQPPPSSSTPLPANATPPSSAVEVAPGIFELVMVKGATGVGFCLEGGKGSPLGDMPIFIKRIFKGGPAEKCGQLKVKDEILCVNGVDFTGMRHYEAWNHLKFLDDGLIRLKIRRK